MERYCNKCRNRYDDAERWTTCPHAVLMSAEDLERKDAAIVLLGKRVLFSHQVEGAPFRVLSCGWNGMVTVEGFVGEFAPHLFRVIG